MLELLIEVNLKAGWQLFVSPIRQITAVSRTCFSEINSSYIPIR